MQHDLNFTFKAHYHTLGKRSNDTRQIWFVLHGYGQLATYFIRKFSALEQKNIQVIAPEGLSHFYLETLQPTGRSSDRVGASWMTKENRLTDIENYVRYLQTVYDQEVGPYNTIPITILGFSQGAATASRWITSGTLNFNRLILWSGVFPPDMDFLSAKDVLKDKGTFFVYGSSDPFVNDSRFAEMNTITDKLGIKPQVVSFDGKHDIDEATLLKFC